MYVYMYQFPGKKTNRIDNESSQESNPGRSCGMHDIVFYQLSYRSARRHGNCLNENEIVIPVLFGMIVSTGDLSFTFI